VADRFETRLERMFAEPPWDDDADRFADRVQGRLGRGERTRKLMIGGAGLIGGVIAVAQVLNANLGAAMQSAGGELAPVRASLAQPLQDERVSGLLQSLTAYLPASSTGTEVVWTVVALGLAGLALLATRLMGEV